MPRGKQARYRLGEGITGRVTETGKPIIVPRVSHEPMFLNRAGERKNLHKQDRTFICVPVVINRKAVGSLGVEVRYRLQSVSELSPSRTHLWRWMP